MGGMETLMSTGVTIEVSCGMITVRAFSANERTSVMTTRCMANEIALDVWSRLNASGSAVNIGRDIVANGASLSEEYSSGACESIDPHVEAPGSCMMRLELLADSMPHEIGFGVVNTELPIEFCWETEAPAFPLLVDHRLT